MKTHLARSRSRSRLHSHRAFGGDRYYRRADRACFCRPSSRARGGAADRASNNMKQLGIALHNYSNAIGAFPPGTLNSSLPYGGPRTTYMIHLSLFGTNEHLQHIQLQHDTTIRSHCSGSWNWNAPRLRQQVISTLLCPSDGMGGNTFTIAGAGTWNRSNYLGFFGNLNYGLAIPGAAGLPQLAVRPELRCDLRGHRRRHKQYDDHGRVPHGHRAVDRRPGRDVERWAPP